MAKSTTFSESNISVANNSSSLTINIWFSAQNSTTWFGSAILYCTCDGVTKQLSVSHPAGGSVSAKFTFDNIKHNDDGKKDVSWSWSCSTSTSALGTQSDSGIKTLTQIARSATLTSASNFTDEENPTIIYSNPAGESVDSIQACISDTDGAVIYAAYRELPKTGTSYTFELTDAERAKLIAAIPKGKDNMYVNFCIKTIIDGEALPPFKTLTRILTVVNAEPEITISVKDIGTGSTALTGDGTVFIKGFNYTIASATVATKKGATVVRQSITNGKNEVSNENSATISGVFENIEIEKFTFSVTDSFGHTVEKPVSVVILPYVKLTCNLNVGRPTVDGDVAFKISGNYYNTTFGAKENTLTVRWRSKENNGEFGEWINTPCVFDGNTYSITINLTKLNYRSAYTFQAVAADKISSNILSPAITVKSIPIYNWGENNFDINVPLLVEGDVTVNGILNDTRNKFDGVLEIGSYDSKTGFKTEVEGQYRNANIVGVEPNTTYTISVDGVPQKFVVLYYDEFRTFISEDRANTTGIITTPENARYLNFRTFASDYTDNYVNLTVQIEQGETVTEHTPHRKYGFTMRDIVDIVYPVGSVYMSANDTDPAVIFGGVWEKIQNKFLLSAGESYELGSTGGQAQVTLKTEQIPGHTHDVNDYSYGRWGVGITGYNDSVGYNAPSIRGLAGAGTGGILKAASTGGGQAHENMPPYLVVNMWKRTA